MKFITNYKSSSYDYRIIKSKIKFIIIHYTAINSLSATLKWLCNPKSKVSSHFLISKNGIIYQLVNENCRAWHAGKSKWINITDINSYSLGIELQNTGHHLNFENFAKKQINSLVKLIKYLKFKYNISSKKILGHSDIAPMRKLDPGERFPWIVLEKNKLTYLPKAKKITNDAMIYYSNLSQFKKKLKKIGYNINLNNRNDDNFKNVIKAFQMHFQQDFVTGYPNDKTISLIEQYCKESVD